MIAWLFNLIRHVVARPIASAAEADMANRRLLAILDELNHSPTPAQRRRLERERRDTQQALRWWAREQAAAGCPVPTWSLGRDGRPIVDGVSLSELQRRLQAERERETHQRFPMP